MLLPTSDFSSSCHNFRMRDLSNHEKNEVGKLTKQIEKQNNDYNNILKDKERLENAVAQLEEQTIDLQEQVDKTCLDISDSPNFYVLRMLSKLRLN